MNSHSDNSDQNSFGLLAEQRCLSADPLSLTLFSFDHEQTDFQTHLSNNIVLVEAQQDQNATAALASSAASPMASNVAISAASSDEHQYLNDSIGLYSYQIIDQTSSRVESDFYSGQTCVSNSPSTGTVKKDEKHPALPMQTATTAANASVGTQLANISNPNSNHVPQPPHLPTISAPIGVSFSEPNQWGHYHHVALCPQFCRIHGMQIMPWCGYVRCHGGHYGGPSNISFRELLHPSPKKRRREAPAPEIKTNPNHYESIPDLISEKSSPSLADKESTDCVQENILPYIGEYELQQSTMSNFNHCTYDQSKPATAVSPLAGGRCPKKKRGRKSKKELV